MGFEPTREQAPLPVFKTGALNHSATLPREQLQVLQGIQLNKCEHCNRIGPKLDPNAYFNTPLDTMPMISRQVRPPSLFAWYSCARWWPGHDHNVAPLLPGTCPDPVDGSRACRADNAAVGRRNPVLSPFAQILLVLFRGLRSAESAKLSPGAGGFGNIKAPSGSLTKDRSTDAASGTPAKIRK